MVSVLVLGGAVSTLQSTLVVPLLPDLPGLLHVSSEDASWLVTITLVTAAVSTPIMGRMADMYGKRRLMVASLGAMSAGSVLCALAPGLATMLVGRALQGCSGAMVAVGISILRDTLPARRMAHAMASMSASVGIGSALGPPVAGMLTHELGWRGVFWSSAACAGLLLIGVLLLVAESRVRVRESFDVGGAVLLSVVLVCLLLPLTKGAAWGWTSTPVVGLSGAGVVALAMWAWLQVRKQSPLVDLRAAARRPVALTHLAGLFIGIATLMNSLATTELLQLPVSSHGQGLSVLQTGLAMILPGTVMMLSSPFAGMMLRRWGGRISLVAGSVVLAAAYLLRIPLSGGVAQIVVSSCIVSVGLSVVFAALPTLILGAVPASQTAAANSLNSLVRTVGSAVASTSIAVVLSASAHHAGGTLGPDARSLRWALLFAVGAALVATVSGLLIPSARRRFAERRGSETDSALTSLC